MPEEKTEYKGDREMEEPRKEDGECGWAAFEDSYTRGRLRETMTDVV